MTFKDFITKQRIAIFLIGIFIFSLSVLMSHVLGFSSLWGELFVDLSASAVTIVFTSFIIDYLGMKERTSKTLNAVSLAEDEIVAHCMRIKWGMARLFGLDRQGLRNQDISSRQEARNLLETLTAEVEDYLSKIWNKEESIKINNKSFDRYLERLESLTTELEQTLILYEYALSYKLREAILNLRSELLSADRLLNFIDSSKPLNESSLSLISVSNKSIYDAVQEVLALSLNTSSKS